MKCYIDGSCGPTNPGGKMGMGVYIEDLDKILVEFVEPHPHNTNNVAEYLALKLLLTYALEKGIGFLHVHSDSKLLVNQMTNRWGIKQGSYFDYAYECKRLIRQVKCKFTWIPREENTVADELSKRD